MLGKAIETIPFAWFDLYVRLIPGLLFVTLVNFLFYEEQKIDNITTGLAVFILAFGVGHAIQPLSSFIGSSFEKLVGADQKRNELKQLPSISDDARAILVSSKQHSEVCSMAAICIVFALFFLFDTALAYPSITSWATKGFRDFNITSLQNRIPGNLFFSISVTFSFFAIGRALRLRKTCENALVKHSELTN